MSELKPCPCGKTPANLDIHDNGQGCKWASVSPDCCGEWMVEFKTEYHPLDSEECKQAAISAWNNAPRATDRDAVIEECAVVCDSLARYVSDPDSDAVRQRELCAKAIRELKSGR